MPLQAARGPLRTFRYAMYFDGIDDYVAVPDGIIPYNSMNWTVMAWVAPVFTGGIIYYQGASEGEMGLGAYWVPLSSQMATGTARLPTTAPRWSSLTWLASGTTARACCFT